VAIALPSLSTRVVIPEVMDRPDLEVGLHRHALDGLARLNWWSGAARPFRPPLNALASKLGGRPIRLLDVATGGGEVPVALAVRLRREGVDVRLTLCDRSARSVAWARELAAAAGIVAEGFVHDVASGSIPGEFDAVISSLFLHHLEVETVRETLATLARAAGRLLLVTDLARTRIGYALAAGASRVLTRSAVVHTDALLSVRAALTPDEALQLSRNAGLAGAAVDRCWPQRWRLTWWRP